MDPLWPEEQIMLMKIADEFTRTEEPSTEDLDRYYFYVEVSMPNILKNHLRQNW